MALFLERLSADVQPGKESAFTVLQTVAKEWDVLPERDADPEQLCGTLLNECPKLDGRFYAAARKPEPAADGVATGSCPL